MKSLENGEKIAPHGIQIGVSEILIARLYKWLLEKKNEIDFLNIKNQMKNFNEAIWEKNIENYFSLVIFTDSKVHLKEMRRFGWL